MNSKAIGIMHLPQAQDVINDRGHSLLQLNEVIPFWQNNSDRNDKKEVLFEVVFDANNNIREFISSLFLRSKWLW